MQIAEPVVTSWEARLGLDFESRAGRTVLADKRFEGPLVVQKLLYPEGDAVCHAIIVHPPAGIVGGDDLEIGAHAGEGSAALLTTPGAAKWYRSAGPWARQRLAFHVEGTLEWLPRETIVFDGALAELRCEVELGAQAKYMGWEVLCLGRTGSGERFARGEVRLETRISRQGVPLWVERGRVPGEGALRDSPAGLAGCTVFGTLAATLEEIDRGVLAKCREHAAVTVLPGLLLARYLGDSSEEAMQRFAALWELLRPAVTGRQAVVPRIWST